MPARCCELFFQGVAGEPAVACANLLVVAAASSESPPFLGLAISPFSEGPMPGRVMGDLVVTPGEKTTARVEGAGGCYELFLSPHGNVRL